MPEHNQEQPWLERIFGLEGRAIRALRFHSLYRNRSFQLNWILRVQHHFHIDFLLEARVFCDTCLLL